MGEDPPAIVLFDGSCGMCTGNMLRGRRWQRAGAIEWVDNGSDRGRSLLRDHGLLGKEQDSLIVIEGDRVSLGSSSIIRTALRLRWPWKASAAMWLAPRPLRDAVYRRVSANRSKHSACKFPAAR
ncbi:MAG TPA: DCC1-like thiol-disulfide oxidoreductase family protein [Candidatus Thermoplasmatota archaeon]|nr:DCC1-like thiol-disulfide oxidoreductase family protein [Candidatus Thermoplasmatota archaeon]